MAIDATKLAGGKPSDDAHARAIDGGAGGKGVDETGLATLQGGADAGLTNLFP
jgi:hypothetical protein